MCSLPSVFFAPGTAEQAGSGELPGVFRRKMRQIRGEERLFPCRSLMPEGIAAHPAIPGCVGKPAGGCTGGYVGLSGSVFLQLNTAGETGSIFLSQM